MKLSEALTRFETQLRADGRPPHTINSYLRTLRKLADWLGDLNVEDVTPDHLARFMVSDVVVLASDGQPKAPISLNHDKSALRALFRYLVETGVLSMSPTRALRSARTGSPLPEVLTPEEAQRLLEIVAADESALARRDHVLFSLLLGTGIRVGSAVRLDVRDVRLEQRRLLIVAKGGRRESVILNKRLVELVRGHLEGLGGGPLFRSRSGARLSVRQIQFRLQGWLDRAGITRPITVHSMRHTFGTRLYATTRDLRLVQRALHHRQVTTAEVYAHLADERLVEALEAM